MMKSFLPPTLENVLAVWKEWLGDRYAQSADRVLTAIFQSILPLNKEEDDIRVKCEVLNELYSTVIFDTATVARHISLANIDERLLRADITLVDAIKEVTFTSGRSRELYSFTTKYCHFHRPDIYPIFDRYVCEALWHINKEHEFSGLLTQKECMRTYTIFVRVLHDFCEHFGIKGLSYKQVDKYLWSYGNLLVSKKL